MNWWERFCFLLWRMIIGGPELGRRLTRDYIEGRATIEKDIQTPKNARRVLLYHIKTVEKMQADLAEARIIFPTARRHITQLHLSLIADMVQQQQGKLGIITQTNSHDKSTNEVTELGLEKEA